MADESPQPVSTFWVTRNRRAGSELPHPEGFDEYASFDQNVKASPTGRIKITIEGEPFVGTIDEINAKIGEKPLTVVVAESTPLDYGSPGKLTAALDAMIEAGVDLTMVLPEPDPKPLHSGLKRNLKEEDRFRSYLEKLRNGSLLSDKELRFLIQFWGIMVRMCEVIGQPYWLALQDARATHAELIRMADERGWTQGIISMYGGIVEGVFEKIL
jgi:hypothetical protein